MSHAGGRGGREFPVLFYPGGNPIKNLVLENNKLALNSLKVHYQNLDQNNTVL